MRISTLIVALHLYSAAMLIAGNISAQSITLNIKQQKIEWLIGELEKQANVVFAYDKKIITNIAPVSVTADKQPLSYVLKQIEQQTPLRFKIVGSMVGITLAQVTGTENKIQQKENIVTGKVTDENNEPLPGVNVIVKNYAANCTITDANGNFRVNLPNGVNALTFSYLGYRTQETNIGGQKSITIKLQQDTRALSEVVVTGVSEGTSRKKLSFALTKINEAQINTVPGVDASQTLRAKVAGIQIDQAGGNQKSTVYLRGAKSVYGNIPPLLVIDGFVTALTLSDLNPQDIESIEVVKGAAASALYGTRGEGGVIQVITKKGKGKLSIVVDNEVGNSSIQREIETNQYHFYQINPDGSFVLNSNTRAIDYQDNGFSVNLHPYQTYHDNLGGLFRSTPYFTNFVSVSTSNDKYSLYTSFQNQYKGSLITPLDKGDTRQTLSFNFGYRPTDRIETEAIFQYYNNSTPSASIAVPTSFTGGSYNNTSLYAALTYEPFINLAEKDAEGKYLSSPTGTDISINRDVPNPFYAISTREYTNNNDNIFAGAKFRYKFSNKLRGEIYGSLQKAFLTSDDYYPIGYETPTANVTLNNGYYGVINQSVSSKNGQAQLNYNDKFGDLDFGATLKAVYEESKLTGLNASGYTLTAPVKSLEVSAINTREISSPWEQTVNYGYFLNFKTGWKDKLFLDVLGRLDRSSRFGSNAATAFFPRVSAAYRLTEDINLKPVTELKFRVAYGQAGTLPPFGAKESRVTITNSGGISYTQNANTNLKRAVTEELEFGFDAELFNKINIQANYASANSKNDFIQVPPFPPTSGSANIYSNLGAVKSNSLEFEINGNVIEKKGLTWNAGLTFSRVRSTITSLGDVPEFTATGGFRKSVGYNPLEYFGPKYLTSLSELEIDANGFVSNAGDGTLRPEDYVVNQVGFVVEKSKLGTAAELPVAYVNSATGNQTYLGSSQPNFILGLSNTFNIGRFSIYGVIDWKNGGYKRNRTQQLITYRYRSTITEDILRAGLPLAFVDAVYGGEQYLWIEKSGYVSLREISLAYSLPVEKIFNKSQFIRNARVALTGRNIYTWTKYDGVSPEGLYDSFDYPNYRIISGKLTLTF